LGNICKCSVSNSSKIAPWMENWARKISVQKGGPNPQPKFQHSSSIRNSLIIRGTEMWIVRIRKKHILDPILAIFYVPLKLEYLTFWHADFCNMFVCAYWSVILKRNIYAWEQCKNRWRKWPTLLWDIQLSCGSCFLAKLGQRSFDIATLLHGPPSSW